MKLIIKPINVATYSIKNTNNKSAMINIETLVKIDFLPLVKPKMRFAIIAKINM